MIYAHSSMRFFLLSLLDLLAVILFFNCCIARRLHLHLFNWMLEVIGRTNIIGKFRSKTGKAINLKQYYLYTDRNHKIFAINDSELISAVNKNV